ncbi:hypothetical protein B296_00002563 [Ensete ventricosum]|uniref:Uncharacterized protein n=1 Tax=Ensete ventricosum TaxID=4639 RepID=A0A427AGC5_ENSVE|nr:hypothetical protein B296_00002563 [Ensete ventricosum]
MAASGSSDGSELQRTAKRKPGVGDVIQATATTTKTATVSIAYCLVYFLVEHSCINSRSLTFGYLGEKPVDIGLMKFLGLCPSALSWYLEFASAFSTFSAPFTTNVLPL